MDELEKARNRIKNRRELPEKNNNNSIILFIVVSAIVLSIYAYRNELIDFSLMYKYINTLPSIILSPFEKTIDLFDNVVEVSSEFPYSLVGEDNYVSDNDEVISLFNGLVVYVGNEDDVYKIIVSYENNVQIIYDNVKLPYVRLYDRVLRDDVIGIYDSYVTMHFRENNEEITFEKIIEKY